MYQADKSIDGPTALVDLCSKHREEYSRLQELGQCPVNECVLEGAVSDLPEGRIQEFLMRIQERMSKRKKGGRRCIDAYDITEKQWQGGNPPT